MTRLMITLILSPLAVCHASPSPSDSLIHCRVRDFEVAPPGTHAAGKRLADLDAGEPRTVRLFYFLPSDQPFRPEAVQRMKERILKAQAFYGEQMEAHGFGYKTFRIETDDHGDPLVHRVDGQHPDSHYVRGTWSLREEIAGVFDLSGNVHVFVIDNRSSRIDVINAGEAARWGKQSGAALVGGESRWQTIAHELGHVFGLHHDFRDHRYIMSYGDIYRDSLSACSAVLLAVHPYFNPDVGVESGEAPAVEVLSSPTYPEGSESVPLRLRVSDAEGLQQVRLIVRTRRTHSISEGGSELKACRGLTGEAEAVVEFDYDGAIPSGNAYGLWDLSNPRAQLIQARAVDREANVASQFFWIWQVSRQHRATLEVVGGVPSLAFSPDGTTLATGSGQGVRLWNLGTRTVTETLSTGLTVVAFSPDGATLAVGSGLQAALWDPASGREVAGLPRHAQEIRSLAFSPDGSLLASAALDEIRLWDVAARTRSGTLPAGALSVAFSPDGATLASGSEDGVHLWDVETQAETATYQHSGDRRTSRVYTVAFSPDGTLVASGGHDTTVRLWEVATGDSVAVLEGHDRPVRSVAFSADGTVLASGADLAVSLWDPVTKQRLATLQGEGRGVNTVAFSPDGTTLAAGTEDGKVALLDVSEWQQARPRRLLMVSGDAQQGTVGGLLADPLVVEVRDQYGNPLPGVEVTFAVTHGDGRVGGRFTLERVTSDSNGRAEALLTLGPAQGTNTVDASVPGLEVLSFSAVPVGEPAAPHLDGDVHAWHLPEGATVRLGKGLLGDLEFSPNGELLAVGAYGGIWLYDVATFREVALLPTGRFVSIAFSHDGTTLASCGGGGGIKLWEVSTGEEIAAIDYRASTVAFSPDGRTLATGTDLGIAFWDLATGTQRAAMSTAEGTWGIHSVAFSPDGKTLAAGSWWDNTVKLWDVETATNIATFEGHGHEVRSVSFSPDGRTVASASDDHTVRLWDVATGSHLATFEGHDSWVRAVDFSPDGRTVVSASVDSTIKLWDLATGQDVTLEGFEDWADVAFSPDGAMVASGSENIWLWDLATGNAVTLATGHLGSTRSVAMSPDGTTLATVFSAFQRYQIYLWDVATATIISILEGHGNRVNSVVFSPDGATLASASSDRTIKLWDVATGADLATFEVQGSREWVTIAAFAPDGRMIASGHGNGTVKVWEVATGANIATFEGDGAHAVESVAFSPNGSTLAAGDSDGTFRVWDLAAGTPILQERIAEEIHAVSFSPDGTALALGEAWESLEWVVSIWAVAPGEDAATLSVEYSGSASTAAFSPDGSVFLAGRLTTANVNVLEVRDVATASLIATLDGHGGVRALGFTRDGRTFASGAWSGTVLVWDFRRILPHPRTLAGLSGDEQEGPTNTALAEPFVVVVTDQNGDPLEGAVVSFSLTGDGGTLSAVADTTDAAGRAATTLTLGERFGTYTVVAAVEDLEPLTFTATARATSDFDGDGVTGLSDFFLFAEAFGGSDPRFDLDGSGSVDFADFFLFAESFGQPARARLLALARERIGLPDGPQLQQNAPNPFNSRTVIPWFLLRDGPARLEVYSLTGQRVAVLHEGPHDAGFHLRPWDGRDDKGRPLASGVYLYRLVTADGAHTRKLTLLR